MHAATLDSLVTVAAHQTEVAEVTLRMLLFADANEGYRFSGCA